MDQRSTNSSGSGKEGSYMQADGTSRASLLGQWAHRQDTRPVFPDDAQAGTPTGLCCDDGRADRTHLTLAPLSCTAQGGICGA